MTASSTKGQLHLFGYEGLLEIPDATIILRSGRDRIVARVPVRLSGHPDGCGLSMVPDLNPIMAAIQDYLAQCPRP